tara:strand:- start:197 stop:424 length:228 start_codon:yes stop_codon:yes gene_type:complete
MPAIITSLLRLLCRRLVKLNSEECGELPPEENVELPSLLAAVVVALLCSGERLRIIKKRIYIQILYKQEKKFEKL